MRLVNPPSIGSTWKQPEPLSLTVKMGLKGVRSSPSESSGCFPAIITTAPSPPPIAFTHWNGSSFGFCRFFYGCCHSLLRLSFPGLFWDQQKPFGEAALFSFVVIVDPTRADLLSAAPQATQFNHTQPAG